MYQNAVMHTVNFLEFHCNDSNLLQSYSGEDSSTYFTKILFHHPFLIFFYILTDDSNSQIRPSKKIRKRIRIFWGIFFFGFFSRFFYVVKMEKKSKTNPRIFFLIIFWIFFPFLLHKKIEKKSGFFSDLFRWTQLLYKRKKI